MASWVEPSTCRKTHDDPSARERAWQQDRKTWTAAAPDRCAASLRVLLEGAVFVAEGDTAPRAHELLEHECGSVAPDERRRRVASGAPLLVDSNPALCDRLAHETAPEAFALVWKNPALIFYYFTYQEIGGKLRMKDVYTKLFLSADRQWPPRPDDHACEILAAPYSNDQGAAPVAFVNGYWAGFSFASEVGSVDGAQLRMSLVRPDGGSHGFRRSALPLEVTPDAR